MNYVYDENNNLFCSKPLSQLYLKWLKPIKNTIFINLILLFSIKNKTERLKERRQREKNVNLNAKFFFVVFWDIRILHFDIKLFYHRYTII